MVRADIGEKATSRVLGGRGNYFASGATFYFCMPLFVYAAQA
jgi:hypothetical protein